MYKYQQTSISYRQRNQQVMASIRYQRQINNERQMQSEEKVRFYARYSKTTHETVYKSRHGELRYTADSM